MRDRVRRTVGAARRVWQALGDPTDGAARAELDAYLLDEVHRRPIVFEDSRGLRYVLEPGENARAYLEHGGNYEVPETRFCERYLRTGSTAVDVGAHIGLYTLLFARLVGETGRVVAFEPAPANHRRLVENLALNGLKNVVAEQAVVFSEPGDRDLHLFPSRLGALHSLGTPTVADPDLPYATVTPERSLSVPGVALDAYLAEHGIADVALLKVDVEGAEADVLAGATGSLAAGRIRVVLFEVSLRQVEALGHTPSAAFDELRRAGMRIHTLEPDGSPGAEAAEPEQPYANYVAFRDEPAFAR